MADYVDGVKIAELPEASSVSDTNILVTEDSDATKQVTADKLKDYTNAELLQRVTDLESQITQLNQSLADKIPTDVMCYRRMLTSSDDINDIKTTGTYYFATSNVPDNSPLDYASTLIVFNIADTAYIQFLLNISGLPFQFAYRNYNGSWRAWRAVTGEEISTISATSENIAREDN